MRHSVLPPLRDESTLRNLVADAFKDTTDSALLLGDNPHRHHRVLGDDDEVDRLRLTPSAAADRIIYPHQFEYSANGRRIGEHHRIVNGEVA